MKKELVIFAFALFVAIPSIGQIKTDTLYYDKDWKGVESKAFAAYFRIFTTSNDNNFRKRFRDYYVTGELQSEGGYLSIDKYDDSKSVFDGECMSYYKSGKIKEKHTLSNGRREGEDTRYKEDGLVLSHAYFNNNELQGVYTEFSGDGNICFQLEYQNGKPLNDYFVISNKDGLCSKIRLSNKEPIYESPLLNEKKIEYKDGEPWQYYNKNGIIIGMTNREVRDYGKYFQIPIAVLNGSMYPIEFGPNNVTASLIDKRGKERTLKVYTAEEYMEKVQNHQKWDMALNGIAEGLAAAKAGYSSSTTNSSDSGYSSSSGIVSTLGSEGYTHGDYSGNSSYYGHSSSTTTTYNGAAAYQAQVIASNRIAAYNDALLLERVAKDEGYLKIATISPGESIIGYINIERKKGVSLAITVIINGANYIFPWDVKE